MASAARDRRSSRRDQTLTSANSISDANAKMRHVDIQMSIAFNQHTNQSLSRDAMQRYDTRSYFNVRSKAHMSRLNLPHGNDN